VMDDRDKKRSAFGLDDVEEDVASEAKKQKIENGGAADAAAGEALTVDGLKQKTPSEKLVVGLGDPLSDFEEMADRNEIGLWERAIKELAAAVLALVEKSVKGLNYSKCAACVSGMRKRCVAKQDARAFNDYIRGLRDSLPAGRDAFWDLVSKDPSNTLISQEEVSKDNDVKECDAASFFSKNATKMAEEEIVAVDDDDLLDDFD